jgi:hypothetical protein
MGETDGQDGREPPRPASLANAEWRQIWVGVRALRQRGDPDWGGLPPRDRTGASSRGAHRRPLAQFPSVGDLLGGVSR